MKRDAHAVLKRAIADHRETLLRDRLSCLGTLRDFGGRDHPEIYLLADAVEEQIFKRLMVSQPVTSQIVYSIANDLAESRSLRIEDAQFAVESWADALSLYHLDPSKYAGSDEDAYHQENEQQQWSHSDTAHGPQVQWYYYEGDARIGPTSEASIVSLIRSRRIKHSTLVWRNGMSRWEPAEENFADTFPNSVSGLPSATTFKITCPNCAQPIEAPLHYLNTTVRCSNCSTAFTAGQDRHDPVATAGPPSTTKQYGGIRRGKFIGLYCVVVICCIIVQAASGISEHGGTTLLYIALIFPVYYRLKNTGTNPWLCLVYWIPIVNIYPMYICLLCQEGYVKTKKLDKAGKTALWILLGIFIILIIVAILVPNVK